ncbi:hypothetical protein [Rathayibacter sp. VKM Ac-2630]|nr:hypothetical protein [Rathayibacter sp. VKM Ac-2630]
MLSASQVSASARRSAAATIGSHSSAVSTVRGRVSSSSWPVATMNTQ